jgi:hypothetical protein
MCGRCLRIRSEGNWLKTNSAIRQCTNTPQTLQLKQRQSFGDNFIKTRLKIYQKPRNMVHYVSTFEAFNALTLITFKMNNYNYKKLNWV